MIINKNGVMEKYKMPDNENIRESHTQLIELIKIEKSAYETLNELSYMSDDCKIEKEDVLKDGVLWNIVNIKNVAGPLQGNCHPYRTDNGSFEIIEILDGKYFLIKNHIGNSNANGIDMDSVGVL